MGFSTSRDSFMLFPRLFGENFSKGRYARSAASGGRSQSHVKIVPYILFLQLPPAPMATSGCL